MSDLRRLAFVLLAVLTIVSGLTADEQATAPKLRQAYHLSFKGRPENDRDFKLKGPNADQCVTFEADGLRIRLPTGFPKDRPVTGLSTGIVVTGDFEITVRFAILKEPSAENAGPLGTRFGLLVGVGPQTTEVARVTRAVRQDVGTQFVAWTNKEKPAIPKYTSTTAVTGQLRLVRSGSTLSYYASEGANSNFILLNEQTIGADDLRDVSIVGQTNTPQGELDVRFTDLHLRAESLPTVSATETGAATETSAALAAKETGANRWLLVIELLGLVIGLALALGLGVWFYRRQVAVPRPSEDRATTIVSVPCSCGKTLKVKTELAGKKVKCSQCGNAVLVPETKVDEAGPLRS